MKTTHVDACCRRVRPLPHTQIHGRMHAPTHTHKRRDLCLSALHTIKESNALSFNFRTIFDSELSLMISIILTENDAGHYVLCHKDNIMKLVVLYAHKTLQLLIRMRPVMKTPVTVQPLCILFHFGLQEMAS
jgi:hypothetical protein